MKKSHHKIAKKSSVNARGVSKIVLVAAVAVLLVGAGGIFLFTQRSGTGASSALPFVKPALNPNCKYNDPELCKFVNNFPTQTNYSVSSYGDYDGMKTESIYEISGEGKFHMVSKLNGKENLNTITIGDTTYTLDYSDNAWWKQTYKPDDSEKSSAGELIDRNTLTKEIEDTTAYKFIVKEPCGDLNCFKYEMMTGNAEDAKMYIWFDDRDYLMRKMRFENKDGLANESTYNYENVSISVPSPVKEGTPHMGNGMPESMNQEEIKQMMQQYQEQVQDGKSGIDSTAPVEYNAPEEY